MSVDGYPVADRLPALEMLVVHMVESFVPRFETLLLQCDDLHTEAAPELTLSVAAYASALELFLDGVIAHLRMVLFEMLRKLFTAVEDLRAVTDLTAGIRLVTPPAFELEMLRVLMTFPVVLAAEDLVATLKGAAVGLGVPLLVLPVGLLVVNLDCFANVHTSYRKISADIYHIRHTLFVLPGPQIGWKIRFVLNSGSKFASRRDSTGLCAL